MGFPVMVKNNQTTGGDGVTIARDPAQLVARIDASGHGRGGLLRRSKRAAQRVLWSMAGVRMTPSAVFELQQFIPGVPAMRVVAAWQGRVLTGVSLLKECVHPQPFGPSTVVSFLDRPEMEATATQLIAALGLSGFASFDFVIAENGDGAFLIELNPRAVASTHLGRLFGYDLCGAFARHLGWLNETPETSEIPKETAVALFPSEIARDPESARLRSGSEVLHDVPSILASSNTATASSCNSIPAMRPELPICFASRTAQPRPESVFDHSGGSDRLRLGSTCEGNPQIDHYTR